MLTETFATRRQPLALVVDVEASEPCVLDMQGFDPDRDHTVYFDRQIGRKNPFTGRRTLVFPLPLSPERLRVRFTPSAGFVTVHAYERAPLERWPLALTPDDRTFIAFAQWIAENLGELKPTKEGLPYQSAGARFLLELLPVIKNRETGEEETTPARISHEFGIIEVSLAKMRAYSVQMRLVVLLHEYMHYKLDTRDESLCDLRGLDIFLSLGYAPTEGLYAFAKVFNDEDDNAHQRQRVSTVLNYLLRLDAQRRPYANLLY